MRMEKINSGTIKVTITNQELDERGIDLLSLLGDEDGIESFLYSILDEIDVDDEFKSTGAVSFQVVPNKSGLDMFIKNKNVFENHIQPMDESDQDEEDVDDNENTNQQDPFNIFEGPQNRSDDDKADLPEMDEFKKFADTNTLFALIEAKNMYGRLIDFEDDDEEHELDDTTQELLDYLKDTLGSLIDTVELSDKFPRYKLEMIAAINEARSKREELDSTGHLKSDNPFLDNEKDIQIDNIGSFNPKLNKWEMLLKISDFENVIRLSDELTQYDDVDTTLYKCDDDYVVRFTTTRNENDIEFKNFTNMASASMEYGSKLHWRQFDKIARKKVIIPHLALLEIKKHFK